MTKIIQGIAKFLSALFSPIFLGTYGVALAIALSYLCYSPVRSKAIVVAVTFVATCVIPVMGIFLLTKTGTVKDPMLNNRTDRTLPYILCILCYIGVGIYFRVVHAPVWLSSFMFGGAAALVILTVVNRWWKISGHATGMGGLTAMIFFLMMSGNSMLNLQPEFFLALLLSGMVCSARLILNRHTLGQVAAGYLNGFLCVFLPAWLIG